MSYTRKRNPARDIIQQAAETIRKNSQLGDSGTTSSQVKKQHIHSTDSTSDDDDASDDDGEGMYPVIDTANMSGETQAMMILISPQENKLAELTKQVQGLQVAYQKEKEEKDLLKKRCSDLESAIKRCQEETQQSKDADETAKLQVAAAQTAAGRTHLELNRANAKILEMETDMACRGVEHKAEIADYQSEIEAYRAEIKQLKGELTQAPTLYPSAYPYSHQNPRQMPSPLQHMPPPDDTFVGGFAPSNAYQQSRCRNPHY